MVGRERDWGRAEWSSRLSYGFWNTLSSLWSFLNDFWPDSSQISSGSWFCAFQVALVIWSLPMHDPSSFTFCLSQSQKTKQIQAVWARLGGSGLELGKANNTWIFISGFCFYQGKSHYLSWKSNNAPSRFSKQWESTRTCENQCDILW